MKIRELDPFIRQGVLSRMTDPRYIGKKMMTKDCRFFYILQGSGAMTVEGARRSLSAGTVVFFQPGTEYVWELEQPVQYAAANFDLTSKWSDMADRCAPVPSADFVPEAYSERLEIEDAPALSHPVVLHGATQFEDKILSLVAEYRSVDGPLRRELLGAMMKYMMISLEASRQTGAYEVNNKNASLAREVVRYIQQNYSEPITNSDIGEHFHFNPSYVNRIFRAQTGKSVRAFIIEYRISSAMELLATESMPISELAAAVGFSDVPHFIKTFKKHVGKTPEAYRRGL